MKKKYVFLIIIGIFLGLASAQPLKAASQNAIEAFNSAGGRVGYFGAGNAGQGTFFLFNTQGKLVAQMGAYETGAEAGQSLFGLHDKNGNLRFLVRLYGEDDSPVIVMKDSAGDDKLMIGLEGQEEMPYIKYRAQNGTLKNLIAD